MTDAPWLRIADKQDRLDALGRCGYAWTDTWGDHACGLPRLHIGACRDGQVCTLDGTSWRYGAILPVDPDVLGRDDVEADAADDRADLRRTER